MKAKKISLKIQLLEIFIFAAIIPMIITALFLYRFEVNRTLNAEILSHDARQGGQRGRPGRPVRRDLHHLPLGRRG